MVFEIIEETEDVEFDTLGVIEEDEEEEEEELIENPDGTMTIRIPEQKKKKIAHACAKCSLTYPTLAVRFLTTRSSADRSTFSFRRN